MAMRDLLLDPRLCGWQPDQVTVIPDPSSVVNLAEHLSDLTEACTGVLLLYYVGHGVLTPRGELCLTVTTTRPDRPKITGIVWELLAEVLQGSPARTRIAILDCCFAGQAIEALAGEDSSGLADLTHVQGVYTLTATTRNRPAHVPPLGLQDAACTSFTSELRALVRSGIPGGPELLTLSDIYPVLRSQLRAKGLPSPNQRGTDTAGLFPFAVNLATDIADHLDRIEVQSSWSQLMGLSDIGTFNPEHAWRPRYGRDRLRVPFGLGSDGLPTYLDIKEAAENGMGPHGLCIGATGSGKSEFLRTLVLSLLATHSPDQLNLVLIDFKGGATFIGLDGVPHIAAVITNLEDEADLVYRMKDALAGEMNRRQEVLRQTGNFANVSEYEMARAAGAELDPLPALFVVLDEFSELLTQRPDLEDLFTRIGRIGRALHIHLLLASQRVEEGWSNGLVSNLAYRICLKTFSANESREVLGVADAYELPNRPGSGYLKSGSGEIVRFQSSYVSGAPIPDGSQTERSVSGYRQPYVGRERSTLDVLTSRIQGHGRIAHEIWLPPLDEAPTLDQLIPHSILTDEYSAIATLRAPMGIVDRPYDQRRDPFVVDLSGSSGHVALVGGPQSGKSTALRSLVMAMSLTHTAEQVQFYCLDFGGGTMVGLQDLPHVGSVASRLDKDRVQRTVAEMTALVRSREERFRRLGIDSMAEFRRLRAIDPSASLAAAGAHADPFGDAFLVIDGYGSIGQDFELLEPAILDLAVRGLSYGVHVVVTLTRWAELPPALKNQIGTRIELRLGEPLDSVLGTEFASLVPMGRPGRGITTDCLHMLTALPRIDGDSDPSTLGIGVGMAVSAVCSGKSGRSAPPVRVLPDWLPREKVLSLADGWPGQVDLSQRNLRIPIGINEAELAPVYIDFAESPHVLIIGDSGSGKTKLLHSIIQGIVASNKPDQARFIVGDYRRSLLGLIPEGYLAGYGSSAPQLTANMNDLAEYVRERNPGSDVTAQQLRDRSWWSGPELYVIIDDYDLVSASMANPLLALVELLPRARDLGFHLITARRSGGAGRATKDDAILARMRDVGAAGLILSCRQEEGVIMGDTEPFPMPPGRCTYVTRSTAGRIQLAVPDTSVTRPDSDAVAP
ncbi:S-DNA-T family DNA segregation ATPase FtsK/SpoIIIE [Nocardia fluminea]|uniref:S-DNA-T family DNA segregation ATPase FtsK/SpoIIIE n=2 Tax=Nocardia fluminea TaxID=134984 RepID=A0A2N3V5B0_9NOCA|nr:S-DNA-T family DNA segregation ATPase FtsK/SpoIIIE [Nocardia fluminea]